MQFALLYQYDPAEAAPSAGEVQDWMDFDQAVKDAGVHVYEAGFQPVTNAQTVRVRDGAATVENGGVAASGPVIAGFWIVDVTDAAAAAEWAQRIPTAAYGAVEVRPVVEFG